MVLTSQGQQNELMNNNTFVLSGILAYEFNKLGKNKLSSTSSVCKLLNVISEMSVAKITYDYKHFKFMT